MDNQYSDASPAFGGLIYLAIFVLIFTGLWKLFQKAGKPGWAVLIPVYNVIVLFEISGKPFWQLILFFIPLANIYVGITLNLSLARSFGKYGFGNRLLVVMFGFITLAAWGFSANTHYVGPSEGPDAVEPDDYYAPPDFR